jgi:hypothetical protein
MTSPSLTMLGLLLGFSLMTGTPARSQVKPGDVINKDGAGKVASLVSPGNLVLVQQGMTLHIVATGKLDWPPPYKAATEKYSFQVQLSPDGRLGNYVAGQPFPLLDPNDPQIATKIMWNFSFKPLYTDDIDIREPELAAFNAQSNGTPVSHLTVGHFAFYNNVGRIEVPPVPTDPDAAASGIRFRSGFFPIEEPATMRGLGILRWRYIDPDTEDNVFVYHPGRRRVRRQQASTMSDPIGLIAAAAGASNTSVIDPDSQFGFAAKIEDYDYKYLGEKNILACVHARNSPEIACQNDGGRTVCPEDWEMRHVYVIEANSKPNKNVIIPKRILYIDSEGWFVTAEDQYDRQGQLWKTIATFNTYRDRPVPDAHLAIYPYNRIFQLAMVDEDLTNGGSSVMYMPAPGSQEKESWYINMGSVNNDTFALMTMQNAGH